MSNGEYITGLETKHGQIIERLQKLQAIEQYLFQQIQDAAASSVEETNEQDLSDHVNTLISQRQSVLSELSNLYNNASEGLDLTTTMTESQATLSSQLRNEIDRARAEEKRLIAQKNNKQRLAQIGEYEYAKNNEHRSVLKIIVYGSFFALILIFLNSKDILPTFFAKILITIVSFITIYMIIVRMFWNYRRNNIDYGKFNFPKKQGEETVDAKYDNNLTFSKILGLECKSTDITEEITEGFSLFNKKGCNCSKNVLPLNLFKNNTLKYSTVN